MLLRNIAAPLFTSSSTRTNTIMKIKYSNICWKDYSDREKEVFLLKRRDAFIGKITRIIGDRNNVCQLDDSILITTSNPKVFFPHTNDGLKHVTIMLSRHSLGQSRSKLAEWALAHECFHMFDPCTRGEACVLEEGLATWFQTSIDRQANKLVEGNEYTIPKKTVEKYINNRNLLQSGGLLSAVRKLRKNGKGQRIYRITSSELMVHVAGTNQDADLLTGKFLE